MSAASKGRCRILVTAMSEAQTPRWWSAAPLVVASALVLAAGVWLRGPTAELLEGWVTEGPLLLGARVRAAGFALAFLLGGGVVARALRAPAQQHLAALGACFPWVAGLVATRAAFEVEVSWAPHVASSDQSFAVAGLLEESLPWAAFGGAASLGLALGALAVAWRTRQTRSLLADAAPLASVAIASAVLVWFSGTLLRSATALRDTSPIDTGDPALFGVAPLLGTEASLEAVASAASRFTLVSHALTFSSLAAAVITLLAGFVIAQRSSGGERVQALLVTAAIAAVAVGNVLADRALLASVERRAHPRWLAVEGLEIPGSFEGRADATPPAGWIVGERFFDAAGLEHALWEEAFTSALSASALDGAVALAVDAAVSGPSWRRILAAARDADVDTLCVAVRETLEGIELPLPHPTGAPWLDALAHSPLLLRCFQTEARRGPAPAEDDLLLHVRLRGRAHPALAARARTEPHAPPVFCPVVDGAIEPAPARPLLYVVIEDDMTTRDLFRLDEDEELRTLTPMLLSGPLPGEPERPAPRSPALPSFDDAPPSPLRPSEPAFGLDLSMTLLYASPLEEGDAGLEVFVSLEAPLDEASAGEADARLRAAGEALGACYEEERRAHPANGGRVQLTMITDGYGVPFDVGCTGSGRSSPELCACLDAALMTTPPDPESARDEGGTLRRVRATLWLQPRGADLPATPLAVTP